MTYTVKLQSLRAGANLQGFMRRYAAPSPDEARMIAVNDLQLIGWDEGVDYHIVSVN